MQVTDLLKNNDFPIGTVELEYKRSVLAQYVSGTPKDRGNLRPAVLGILVDPRLKDTGGYLNAGSIHQVRPEQLLQKAKLTLEAIQRELAQRV
jgi:hypothetical protein